MAAKRTPTSTEAMILDGDTPLDHRKQLLMHLCIDGSEQSEATVKALLESATAASGETVYKKKCQEVESIKQQLLDGPLR